LRSVAGAVLQSPAARSIIGAAYALRAVPYGNGYNCTLSLEAYIEILGKLGEI